LSALLLNKLAISAAAGRWGSARWLPNRRQRDRRRLRRNRGARRCGRAASCAPYIWADLCPTVRPHPPADVFHGSEPGRAPGGHRNRDPPCVLRRQVGHLSLVRRAARGPRDGDQRTVKHPTTATAAHPNTRRQGAVKKIEEPTRSRSVGVAAGAL